MASCHIEALKELAKRARHETITLVYSASGEDHNQAVALQGVLDAFNVGPGH